MKLNSIRGHIVIVEDNLEISEILTDMIREFSAQIQVTCFTSSKQALTYLLQNPDSVSGVISDLMMPEMDGIDFLASLRKDPRTQGVPFLFLSGAEPSVFSNLLRGYQFSGFIPKPIEAEALKNMIEFNFRSMAQASAAA
jgi:CheY-like chemotaxis protein